MSSTSHVSGAAATKESTTGRRQDAERTVSLALSVCDQDGRRDQFSKYVTIESPPISRNVHGAPPPKAFAKHPATPDSSKLCATHRLGTRYASDASGSVPPRNGPAGFSVDVNKDSISATHRAPTSMTARRVTFSSSSNSSSHLRKQSSTKFCPSSCFVPSTRPQTKAAFTVSPSLAARDNVNGPLITAMFLTLADCSTARCTISLLSPIHSPPS